MVWSYIFNIAGATSKKSWIRFVPNARLGCGGEGSSADAARRTDWTKATHM